MKRIHSHLSASGLLAAWGVYRELWAEIPGTGQSAMDLLKLGYSHFDLVHYFPGVWLNVLLMGTGFGLAVTIISVHRGGKRVIHLSQSQGQIP